MSNPILKQFNGSKRRVIAHGGLHMIRGNKTPYFSLTMSAYRLHGSRWIDDGSGADHRVILKIWPELKQLADLHLSDIDGVPMHVEANGWYCLAGTVDGGFGERFHAGNSTPQRNAAECLRLFADIVRISHQDAADLREHYLNLANCYGLKQARDIFKGWVESQKPRWRAEANACIQALQLQVFGDQWLREAAPA